VAMDYHTSNSLWKEAQLFLSLKKPYQNTGRR